MQLELNKSSWSQPDKPYWEMPEAQPVEERVSLDKMQDLSWLKTNEELLQLNESDEFKDLSWLKTEEELNRLDGNVFTDIKNRELQHGYFTNSGLIWGQVLLGVKSQDEAYKEQKQVDYKYRGIEDIQLPNWRENPIRSAVTSGYGIARYVVDSAAFATAVAGGTRLAGKTAAKGAAALAGKTALKAVPYVGWGIAGFEAVSAISKAPTFALSTIARIGFLEGGMIMKNMLDHGVSVPVARALSISAGAVIGAIEVFFMKPFAMFGEAASNMFRKTITSGAAKATLRAVTQKMLADASMKGLLIEAAKNVGWNTAEELVQQLTEETANLIASKLEDKPELIKSPEEFREMMLDTLVETASGMGVVGLFGISAKHLSAKAQIGRMKLTLALQKRADGEELSPSEQKLVSEHDAENKKRKDEIFERERKAEQMLIDEDKAAEKEISEETKKEQEEAEVKLQEELQQEIDIEVEKEAVDQDVSEVIESVEEYDDRKANALIKNVESKKEESIDIEQADTVDIEGVEEHEVEDKPVVIDDSIDPGVELEILKGLRERIQEMIDEDSFDVNTFQEQIQEMLDNTGLPEARKKKIAKVARQQHITRIFELAKPNLVKAIDSYIRTLEGAESKPRKKLSGVQKILLEVEKLKNKANKELRAEHRDIQRLKKLLNKNIPEKLREKLNKLIDKKTKDYNKLRNNLIDEVNKYQQQELAKEHSGLKKPSKVYKQLTILKNNIRQREAGKTELRADLKKEIKNFIETIKNLKLDTKEEQGIVQSFMKGITVKSLETKLNNISKKLNNILLKKAIEENTGFKKETKTVKIMKNMAEMYKAQIKAVGYTLKNAKAVAKKMVQQLKESGLDPKNQAKFMTFITNNLKPETFEKNQNVFFERISRNLEQQETKKAKEARKARHKELKVIRKKMLSLARANGGKITAIAKDNVNNLLSGMDKEDINDMSLLQLKLEEAAKMIEEGKKDFAEKVRQRRKEVKMFYLAAEEAKEKGIKLGIKSAQFGKLQSAFGEGGAFNRAIAFLRNAFIKLQFKKHDIYFTDCLLDEIDGKQGYKGFVYKTFGIDVNQSYDNFDKAEIAYMDRVQKIMRDNKITEQDLFAVMIYSIAQQKDGIDIILTQNFKEFQTEQDVVNFRLSDKQSEVYNEMQNIYEEIYPQLREVMQDVYNENIGWIEKYSPFLLDWASMSDLTIDDMAVGFGAGKSEGARSTIFNPFAKTRFGKEGLLNRNAYDVFTKYVRDTTYLIHMAKAIQRNANIVNSEGFSDVVGDIGQDILRRNTELLANKGRADAIIPFLDTLRKNVSNATLAFKITSALVQWTSILHAASLIDSYAFMGLAHAFSVEDLDFVIKNMPEVARRVGDDPAVLDTQLNKLTRTGSSAMVFIDKRMAVATAWGAYAKWCDENGVVFDKNNPHADGLTYAQDIVAKTQASQRITRLPMILKSGDFLGLEGKPIGTSLSKAIFQFQSFVINEWGLFAHDIMGYGFKDPKRTATGLLWLNVAKIAETALRMGGWMLEDAITGDDKDRDFFWELIENYIQGMPVVAQIYGGIAYGEVPIPAISMLQKALKKAKQEKNVAAAVLLLGALKGVPGAGLFHRIDRGSKKKQRITY